MSTINIFDGNSYNDIKLDDVIKPFRIVNGIDEIIVDNKKYRRIMSGPSEDKKTIQSLFSTFDPETWHIEKPKYIFALMIEEPYYDISLPKSTPHEDI